jgi:pimeloyl-ACP methyl ester carboxylesterase
MKAKMTMKIMRAIGFVLAVTLVSGVPEVSAQTAVAERSVETHETSTGVAFGSWGSLPDKPTPTLFVLASTIKETLGDAYFRQCGNALSAKGYLLVSIDLPCHGKEHRAAEPAGLTGWRHRCEQGDDFVADSNKRLARVLDHLIAAGHTDATKVAACGTSRGGYLALHFGAHDPRVKCVAAFAPVTELAALREFQGAEKNALVQSLTLNRQAEKLAGRAVWIIIGDQDERVGTDHAIDLARRVTRASLAKKLPSRVDLHVVAEPRGHTTPAGAPELSASWIRRQIEAELPGPKPRR